MLFLGVTIAFTLFHAASWHADIHLCTKILGVIWTYRACAHLTTYETQDIACKIPEIMPTNIDWTQHTKHSSMAPSSKDAKISSEFQCLVDDSCLLGHQSLREAIHELMQKQSKMFWVHKKMGTLVERRMVQLMSVNEIMSFSDLLSSNSSGFEPGLRMSGISNHSPGAVPDRNSPYVQNWDKSSAIPTRREEQLSCIQKYVRSIYTKVPLYEGFALN